MPNFWFKFALLFSRRTLYICDPKTLWILRVAEDIFGKLEVVMFPDLGVLYDLGVITPDSPVDEAYREWLEALANEADPTPVNSGHGLKVWIVIRLRTKEFSEHLDYSEEFGMYLPKKGHGELWGVATNPSQVEHLISGSNQNSQASFVFLVYKARIKGEEQWGPLIEFLAQGNMLEQEF